MPPLLKIVALITERMVQWSCRSELIVIGATWLVALGGGRSWCDLNLVGYFRCDVFSILNDLSLCPKKRRLTKDGASIFEPPKPAPHQTSNTNRQRHGLVSFFAYVVSSSHSPHHSITALCERERYCAKSESTAGPIFRLDTARLYYIVATQRRPIESYGATGTIFIVGVFAQQTTRQDDLESEACSETSAPRIGRIFGD